MILICFSMLYLATRSTQWGINLNKNNKWLILVLCFFIISKPMCNKMKKV